MTGAGQEMRLRLLHLSPDVCAAHQTAADRRLLAGIREAGATFATLGLEPVADRWLERDAWKRIVAELLLGDLLSDRAARRRVLEVGGGLSRVTLALLASHDYTLVDRADHEGASVYARVEEAIGRRFVRIGDWHDVAESGPFDVVIANDLFPNVDQRLYEFADRYVPLAAELRLSLTYYENTSFDVVREATGERLVIKPWGLREVTEFVDFLADRDRRGSRRREPGSARVRGLQGPSLRKSSQRPSPLAAKGPGVTRALFLGQKPIGEAAWRMLRDREEDGRLEVVAVCSNQDASSVWWRSNEVFRTCGDRPFIDNGARNEEQLRSVLEEMRIDALLCVHHPWILSDEVLRLVDYNALTLHNAKLPTYRGHNAVNHALLNGDGTFTCTAHWMADEVDAGDIAFECTVDIESAETALSLYAKGHHAALRLFAELLRRLDSGEAIPRRAMPSGGAFYARDSIEDLREIRDLDPRAIEVRARAFYFPPFEPAYISVDGRKLYVTPAASKTPDADPRGELERDCANERCRGDGDVIDPASGR